MAKFLTLIVFIILLQVVGGLIGATFSVDEWYQLLKKPPFNPTSAVFPVVWPVLYVLIAVAGWRVFMSEGKTPGWGLWVIQLLLNWAWSPVFFGAHQIFWGIWVIFGALLASISFIAAVWHHDRLAGLCFIPYAAWLAFALLLNTGIWLIN